MEIKIPEKVAKLLSIIESNYEAFIVGGCVRDSIIGREPNDWDICTNAKPEEVLELFENHGFRVIPTGLKHGTITVVFDDEHYEVTTYRVDSKYTDGRHPDVVTFTSRLEDDLSRRDFTINAMAYSVLRGLVDPFNGVQHITEKRIVAVGSASERYQEDALRMMRAVRFASQLGFEIGGTALTQISMNALMIKNISWERVRDELNKILVSDDPDSGILLLQLTGLLKLLLPELCESVGFNQYNPNHNMNVFDHILSVIKNTPPNLKTRLAALFHDIAKPRTFTKDESGIGHFYNHAIVGMDMSKEIMQRLKYDNQLISDVGILVKEHMNRHKNVKLIVAKKFIGRVGEDNIQDLFDLMVADTLGSKPPYDYSDVDDLKRLCESVINEEQPLRVKDLVINGTDLMSLGYKQSKELGYCLNELLELVLESPELNTKEELLMIAKRKLL